MSRRPRKTILTVNGTEVSISNPGKVLFPEAGYTKLDLVNYYLAVAEGALRGAGGRPNVLVRYPNGIGEEFFYQKRAPESRPEWIEVVALKFPSGRTAEEVVPRDAAALAWMANLGVPRAASASGPRRGARSSRRAARRSRSGARRRVAAGAGRGEGRSRRRSTISGWSAGRRRRDREAFTSTSAFTSDGPSPRCAAPRVALAREVERRAPAIATSKWWKEERHGVFIDYNQNAKDRTVCSAFSVRPRPDARVSTPLTWEEIDACDPADFTMKTMPAWFKANGDRHAEIDRHPARSRRCSSCRRSRRRKGRATRRGRRNTRRCRASRPACSPRARKPRPQPQVRKHRAEDRDGVSRSIR